MAAQKGRTTLHTKGSLQISRINTDSSAGGRTAAKTAASFEVAAAETEDGNSIAAGGVETMWTEVEAVVPSELGGRGASEVTASKALEACNHATYRAPRE
eukprot:scaffold3175_cov68-Phaeocystis_antarctica.AAC.3